MFEKQKNIDINGENFFGFKIEGKSYKSLVFDDMLNTEDCAEQKGFELIGMSFDDENEEIKYTKIAYADFLEFPTDGFTNEYIEKYHPKYNRYDMMDAYSQETTDIADALKLDNYKKSKFSEEIYRCPVICLEKFVVDKKYRGYGFGKEIMSNLPFILLHACESAGIIAFTAFPFEDKGKSEEILKKNEQKLYKFYKDCGYTKCADYGVLGGRVFAKVPDFF